MNGLDSASHLNAKAAKSSGYAAWGRYLTGGYALAIGEVQDATAHGIGIWSIFENRSNNALGGAGQAAVDAQTALKAAAAMKQPKGSAIYCTVDFDPTPAQLVDVITYCRAFVKAVQSDGYKGGVYGGASVMKATSFADYRWQAAGWSYGETVPGCVMYQKVASLTVGGVSCDLNVIAAQNYGAWNGNGLFPQPPAPKPTPKPPTPKPQPTPDPTENAVIHTVTGKIGSNGEVIIDTNIPWVNRIAATAQTEQGAQSTATVRWTNANNNIRLVVRGNATESVSIDVAATK